MTERMKVELGQKLRQEQRLSPRMVQSMEVLQMSSQELLEHINRAEEENPLLEREEPSVLRAEYRQLCSRISWLDTPASAAAPEGTERGRADWETESLCAFLCDQLDRRDLQEPLASLCRYLARMVDEDGYLRQEDLDSVLELEIPSPLVKEAVSVLQSLEPAGVAARDLSECLLLQLRRGGVKGKTVRSIVKKHLNRLGKHQYGAIARDLGVSEKEVRAAEAQIAALDPRPGRSFQPPEAPIYIRPDVFVAELDGSLQVVLNEYYLPRMTLSSYYTRLLSEAADAETTTYLRDKMRQAQWLLYSLSQRGATLRRCAEAVLEQQRAFFEGQSCELQPMSLKELAQQLELHPSTVTRCVQGKYLQCRQGTYPLRYFFSLPSGGLSRQAVQQKLLQLVSEEDKSRPFSDQQLCQQLLEQGVEVSRRTVAKYRAELEIPSTSGRRRREKE